MTRLLPYLRLSEAYEDEAARAAGLGWPLTRLASHHLALLPADTETRPT